MIGWALLSVLYWTIAHRVLRDSILFRIYEKRDRLRSLAIEGKIDADSFEYNFLEERLCQTAYVMPSMNIYNFARFILSDISKEPLPDLLKFTKVASIESRELWENSIKDVGYMMLLNSPIIAIISGIVFVILEAQRKKAEEKVPNFFEYEINENRNSPSLAIA